MSLTIVLYLIICVFLIFFSLLQQNQSGGMGVLGGSSSTLLGTEQMSFLSKIVAFFAVLYFAGSFFLNVISSSENPVFVPDIPEQTQELKKEDDPTKNKIDEKNSKNEAKNTKILSEKFIKTEKIKKTETLLPQKSKTKSPVSTKPKIPNKN